MPPAGIVVLSVPNPSDTVYLDSDVKPGSTYYYTVAGVTADGGVGLKAASSPLVATAQPSDSATPTATQPALSAPPAFMATAFPYPYVALHWSYPTGSVSFIVERALVSTTSPLNWQVRLRTGTLPCCLMTVTDRGDDLPATQRAVYRVTAVDPVSPTRKSPPTQSPEINPGAVRTFNVESGGSWLLPAAVTERTLRVGQLGGTGFVSTKPSLRIVSLDESIVSVNATDGLYRATVVP